MRQSGRSGTVSFLARYNRTAAAKHQTAPRWRYGPSAGASGLPVIHPRLVRLFSLSVELEGCSIRCNRTAPVRFTLVVAGSGQFAISNFWCGLSHFRGAAPIRVGLSGYHENIVTGLGRPVEMERYISSSLEAAVNLFEQVLILSTSL
jgi:hypothetical protein